MKLLLLQFRTDQSLEHERECFKKFLPDITIDFVNVFGDEHKEILLDRYDGIIIAGSGQFDVTALETEKQGKINELLPILAEAIKNDFPTLGICFGHQLLTLAGEGNVEKDPQQAEGGNVWVKLNNHGKNSPLFKNLESNFWVNAGHKDSVTQLPRGFTLLASSDRAHVQAMQKGKNVFGVQFHPELDLDELVYRFSLYPVYMRGKTIDEIRENHKETPAGPKILLNFLRIVETR